MKVRIDRGLFLFLIFILVFSLCFAASAEDDEWVDVIVRLKDKKGQLEKRPAIDHFKALSSEQKKAVIKKDIKKRKENIRENQEEFLKKIRAKKEQVGFKYKTVNAVAMRIKKSEFEALRNNPDVEHIEEDMVLHAAVQTSIPLIAADTVHNMNIGGTNVDGSGFSVCVVDSGVDYSHPAFGGCTQAQFLAGKCTKVPFGYDFYNNDNDPIDDYYHGTHVAGISSLSSPAGVAPGSKIIAMKTLSSSGSGTGSQVLAGIDACIANASLYNITAITLSLGNNQVYSNASFCDNSTIGVAINNAVAAGIFVSVASGNNAGTSGVSYPACVSNATSVGSTKDTGWGTVDTMSSFTNRGLLLDLLAPGERINSTRLNNQWSEVSGTSQAAPHVSGAAALLQHYSMLKNGQSLTPNEMRSILKKTGKSVYDSATSLTFPRINLTGAVNSILSISGRSIYNKDGKVSYASATDITDAQHCVNISHNKLQIDPSDAYCTKFNTTANITLNKVGSTKTPVILEDGQICPPSICSLISWNGENITFSVPHFSTYSTAATGSLAIHSKAAPVYTYNNTYFYANYTNYTKASINDNSDNGQCNISFNISSDKYQMAYNTATGLYEYNRIFTQNQAGSVSWTVECDSQYEPQTKSGVINVLSSGNTAPSVNITAPPNASVFETGDQINFTGAGNDREDSLTLTWYSSVDGHFGTGTSVNKTNLSTGNHTITLNTTDSGSLQANDSIMITINAI
ncbi:S8 family serine peptidase, partial [Candidatus Woesearchaeota archaeon]|nr:S8 family serine peptidase [Candidatus Woesearchaeota archaeon]